MTGPLMALRGAAKASRERLSGLAGQSERTILLGTVLLVSAFSATTAYVLSQWFAVDVPASLLSVPEDCWLDWGIGFGRHCFSDYALTVDTGLRANPWTYPIFLPWDSTQPFLIGYPAGGMLPGVIFGVPAQWLGAPQLGLVLYLMALTLAVLLPAIWAAKGTRGLERVVVFVALGAAAVPIWAVIDRGNTAGFLVPAALLFLIALRRQRWGLVAIAVILAALVKPMFAILVVALLAARQWRMAGLAVVGVGISNIAAYLLWPRDFPSTIVQTIRNLSIDPSFESLISLRNLSFGRALLVVPDMMKFAQTGGELPDDYLAGARSLIGYAVALLIMVALFVLGRRIPPVLVGIVLLATATLLPPVVFSYYLVFALPVAAVIVRDPEGPRASGIFDYLSVKGDRRRFVGICTSLAVALSIAQMALPGQASEAQIFGQLGAQGLIGTTLVVGTTVFLTPFLWIATCVSIIVSYARRPDDSDEVRPMSAEGQPDTEGNTTAGQSELVRD
ncbi:hypothetical protein AU184_15390 [Mycolicibacterium novocastrense]|uniref:glycosyltransferase family 87 protein n=1 Tax=Mycolicibacterium novocastrense TaxID=59813 RepID=UPI000749322B|nr:glycosyltransferase family 87 protein [Mycolicibacterium novocastrense]KUH75772.1 hypothetical protein AU183_00410 [Mycolicibacterium novocastrense]KUH78333.1 hypothetical protein AU072_10470 [Mycolicibacterium novocastrense]KUH79668.1 hypothetical protein AU184_15390 [Mycolicibacterium novocastrense]